MGDRPWAVLGIETSCDETAAAVVTDDYRVLADVVLSQEDHAPYGGVVPELASRAHLGALCAVCQRALSRAGLQWHELAGIAVTCGPGLVGSLVVGLSFAKGLVLATGLPLVGVHHLEGHIFANRLASSVTCPVLVLLVSGGHTQLVLVPQWGQYEVLGRTRDDAAGEAFDKVAKLLGLIPGEGVIAGGRVLSRCAESGRPDAIPFPRALRSEGNYDFSFSGLKTAVLTYYRALPETQRARQLGDIAASFQAAVVDVLVQKTTRAMRATGAMTVALAGGVAANLSLRDTLRREVERLGGCLHCPPPALCTDNGAMIAAAGAFHLRRGDVAALDLDADPRLTWETWAGMSTHSCSRGAT